MSKEKSIESASCKETLRILSERLGTCLTKKREHIAVAESCTGGAISAAITDVPGSSSYFGYGIISYSNQAKEEILKVSTYTLREFGAVSRQTAVEMAEGVRRLASARYGLSVTGIAGPGGGTKEKPVGLVFVGFSRPGFNAWTKLRLSGTRQEIRAATVEHALEFALDHINMDPGSQ